MDVISIIEATLAPLLLVSSTGLLILGMGNRMGRVVDRLREFSREIRTGKISEERKKVILKQKDVLVTRARLCRNAMLYFHLTILFVSLTSLFLYISQISRVFEIALIVFFSASLITLIVGSIYALYEIALSYHAILNEVKTYLR